jgi:hypothetical protein
MGGSRSALQLRLVLSLILGAALASAASPVAATRQAASSGAGAWNIEHGPKIQYGQLAGITALSPSDAWAVGLSGQGSLIEHWNGRSWAAVSSYIPSDLHYGSGNQVTSNQLIGVAASSTKNAWAVGDWGGSCDLHPLIVHWNGQRWSMSPTNIPMTWIADLYSVSAISNNDAWATGSYRTNGRLCGPAPLPGTRQTESVDHPLVEHWNGKRWNLVQVPSDTSFYSSLTSISVISPRDIWAAGNASWGSSNRPLIEHFNGRSWRIIPMPDQGIKHRDALQIKAITDHNVWLVGYHETNKVGPHTLWTKTLIEHWNGSRWSLIPSPNSTCHQNVLGSITMLGPQDGWAAGAGNYCGRTKAKGIIERWNGQSWTLVPLAKSGAEFSSLVFPTSATGWAVGSWSPVGGTRPFIERYRASP